jgi:hypothetical protein
MFLLSLLPIRQFCFCRFQNNTRLHRGERETKLKDCREIPKMIASLTSSSVATRDAICRLQQYARKRTEERGGLLAAGAQEDLLFGAVQKN